MEGRRPRILIVEDNEATARSIALFLQAAELRTSHAATAAQGLQQLGEGNVDLVLLDLNLPDQDGLSVCKTMLANTAVPIIMLTARTSENDIVAGLEAGAIDYIRKPFGSKELVARVKRHVAGKETDGGNHIRIGDLEIDREARKVAEQGNAVSLTKSEFEILWVLASRPGRVFTRSQLIESALGIDFDGFDRTVDTHIWSIRKKLNENRLSPRYIMSEVGVGYRMNPDA